MPEQWVLMCFTCLQYDYSKMLDYSHQFYRSQWVGDLDGHNGIPTWRASPYAFTTEVGPTRLNWGDITGGVMEGGDAGRHLSC